MNRPTRWIFLVLLASTLSGGSAFASRPRHPGPPRPPRLPHLAHFDDLGPPVLQEVRSELMATTRRAEDDLQVQVMRSLGDWLTEDGVPADWQPPRRLVNRMKAGKVYVEPVRVADQDVFRASMEVDFSPGLKREFLEAYRRQEGGRRLVDLGGMLAFVLACLAAVNSYIRADEATKGYFTNRLRLVAAAGVGAAGVAIYQLLT